MKVKRLEEPVEVLEEPVEVKLVLTVKKSAYGWTAYHPSGRAVAHAKERAWLDAYVKEST